MLMKICTVFCIFWLSVNNITCFATQTHRPITFLKEIENKPCEGVKIVQEFCASCHAPHPLIPLNAPIQADKQAWLPRVKSGLATLFKHVEEGYGAMPARGGCFECTDKQLYLAIIALLPDDIKKSMKLNDSPPHHPDPELRLGEGSPVGGHNF